MSAARKGSASSLGLLGTCNQLFQPGVCQNSPMLVTQQNPSCRQMFDRVVCVELIVLGHYFLFVLRSSSVTN